MTVPTVENQLAVWPKNPYKGLSYYGPADRPLYAGRDDDIRRCSAILMLAETRTLLLHGKTASGKSSFLRAGLIPTIESEAFGYEFLKDGPKHDLRALFIRCTNAPLKQLADRVFEFANSDYEVQSPIGRRNLDLRETLGGVTTLEEFRARASNEGFLAHTLQEISSRLPKTLIVVLDQAEEVLTLNPTDDRGGERQEFFSFLQEFNSMLLDFKLVIALRTEYYGRFFNAMNIDSRVRSDAKEYLLEDLNRTMLREAIERPTLGEEVPPWGVPFDIYRFQFESGLPQRIANDLLAAKQAGGVLPVMQIVCRSLYEEIASKETDRLISMSQYEKRGGVEGRIDEHIQRSLHEAFRRQNLAAREVSHEEERWRLVLCKLAAVQEDGTVTTNVLPLSVIEEEAKDQHSQLSPAEVLDHLASSEVLLVRRLSLLDVATAKPVDAFSLGHDVIGLSLNRWRTTHDEQKRSRRQLRLLQRYVALGALIIGVALFLYSLAQRSQRRAIVRNDAERIARQAKAQGPSDYQLGLLLALAANRVLSDANLEDATDLPRETLVQALISAPDRATSSPIKDNQPEYLRVFSSQAVLCGHKLGVEGLRTAWEFDLDATTEKRPIQTERGFLFCSSGGTQILTGSDDKMQFTSEGKVVTLPVAQLLKRIPGRPPRTHLSAFGREVVVLENYDFSGPRLMLWPLFRHDTKATSYSVGPPKDFPFGLTYGNRSTILYSKKPVRESVDFGLWNVDRNIDISMPVHPNNILPRNGIASSPRYVFASDDSALAVINNMETNQLLITILAPNWTSKIPAVAERATIKVESSQRLITRTVAVGPLASGLQLAVGGEDGSVQVAGSITQQLFGMSHLLILRFTDDGSILVALTDSGEALIWSTNFDDKKRRMKEMPLPQMMTRACQIAGRPFTHAELLQYFGSTELETLCAEKKSQAATNAPHR